eukprot:237913-Rhodomonas_salina.1
MQHGLVFVLCLGEARAGDAGLVSRRRHVSLSGPRARLGRMRQRAHPADAHVSVRPMVPFETLCRRSDVCFAFLAIKPCGCPTSSVHLQFARQMWRGRQDGGRKVRKGQRKGGLDRGSDGWMEGGRENVGGVTTAEHRGSTITAWLAQPVNQRTLTGAKVHKGRVRFLFPIGASVERDSVALRLRHVACGPVLEVCLTCRPPC